MEPGLLGLPAFCSGDQAVLILVQSQERSTCRVPLLGSQETYQGILGKSRNASFPAVIQGPTEDILGLISITIELFGIIPPNLPEHILSKAKMLYSVLSKIRVSDLAIKRLLCCQGHN